MNRFTGRGRIGGAANLWAGKLSLSCSLDSTSKFAHRSPGLGQTRRDGACRVRAEDFSAQARVMCSAEEQEADV